MDDYSERRAKEIFRWYMTVSFTFLVRLRLMFRMMFYMQTCLRNRFFTREAKLEILENAWFKFLGILSKKQNEIGDVFTSEMIQNIVVVPYKIRRRTLEEFLRCS